MKLTERMNEISLNFQKKKKKRKEKNKKYDESQNLKSLRDSQKRNGWGKKNIKDIEKRGSTYNHP